MHTNSITDLSYLSLVYTSPWRWLQGRELLLEKEQEETVSYPSLHVMKNHNNFVFLSLLYTYISIHFEVLSWNLPTLFFIKFKKKRR